MTIFAGRLGWYLHWRDQMRGPDSGLSYGPSSGLSPGPSSGLSSGPSSGPSPGLSSGLVKFKLDIRYERNSKLPEVWQRVHLF